MDHTRAIRPKSVSQRALCSDGSRLPPIRTGVFSTHGSPSVDLFPQDHVIVVRFGITDGGVDSWDEVAFDIAVKLTTS
jgi:hypothetical protein